MEPLNPSETAGTLDTIVTILGGVVITVLAWLGKNKKPEPATVATLSGALMDNTVVDPLLFELRRLNNNLERELTEKQREAEQERRREEREDIAKAVFEQLKQDMLAHPPADMPTIRKPAAPRKP